MNVSIILVAMNEFQCGKIFIWTLGKQNEWKSNYRFVYPIFFSYFIGWKNFIWKWNDSKECQSFVWNVLTLFCCFYFFVVFLQPIHKLKCYVFRFFFLYSFHYFQSKNTMGHYASVQLYIDGRKKNMYNRPIVNVLLHVRKRKWCERQNDLLFKQNVNLFSSKQLISRQLHCVRICVLCVYVQWVLFDMDLIIMWFQCFFLTFLSQALRMASSCGYFFNSFYLDTHSHTIFNASMFLIICWFRNACSFFFFFFFFVCWMRFCFSFLYVSIVSNSPWIFKTITYFGNTFLKCITVSYFSILWPILPLFALKINEWYTLNGTSDQSWLQLVKSEYSFELK